MKRVLILISMHLTSLCFSAEQSRDSEIEQLKEQVLCLSNQVACLLKNQIKENNDSEIQIQISHLPKIESSHPIIQAAILGNKVILDYLLDNNLVSIDFRDGHGDTAQMHAYYNLHFELAKYLQARGANINTFNHNGRTVLMESVYLKDFRVMNNLIENGANLELKDHNGDTALILASKEGLKNKVETLLKAGANINSVNKKGETALMCAFSKPDVLLILLNEKPDFNLKNNNGDAFIHLSVDKGFYGFYGFLKTSGADIHARNKLGHTALRIAAIRGRLEAIKELLELGLDPNSCAYSSKVSILDIIVGHDRFEVFKVFFDFGVKFELIHIINALKSYSKKHNILKFLINSGLTLQEKNELQGLIIEELKTNRLLLADAKKVSILASANLNFTDEIIIANSIYILLDAVKKGDIDNVRDLLQLGFDPYMKEDSRWFSKNSIDYARSDEMKKLLRSYKRNTKQVLQIGDDLGSNDELVYQEDNEGQPLLMIKDKEV